ncbi:MAG TPA: amidohydrolase family protein [Gemmatimonadaceae bacterium]|nr:amidohydrolase family protein [Gemmatimonadaceae bacterium]
MRHVLFRPLAGACAAGVLLAATAWAQPRRAAAPAAEQADLVFVGGAVYTVDAARSWATAAAVRGGRIVYVGDDAGARRLTGARTRVVELRGRMLLPGFQDSHVHPGGGLGLTSLRLHGVFDRTELFRRVREFAAANPAQPWITGGGWEVGAFKPAGVPSRQMLDSLVPDRPAFLSASDGHTGWANSRALALAGVTRATADPPNGIVGRDPATGEPDGALYEAAKGLVQRHVPRSTPAQRARGDSLFLAELWRNGITAVVDAGAGDEGVTRFAARQREGLPIPDAVICHGWEASGDDDRQVAAVVAWRARHPSGTPRATCVKLMLDGIIEQYTGRLLEPYVGRGDDRGPLFIPRNRLHRLVTRLDSLGFQIHVHAIADGAVREALDAFAAARRANGARDARHTLAHVQLIDPADIPRLRELGVIAAMSPLWARGDDLNREFAEPRLGPMRSRWLYPHLTMLGAGARIAWGTDWPVTSLVPVEGLETAVTRRHLGGRDADGRADSAYIPAERLTLEQAIAAYTIDGAYQAFRERERGSIEPGKRADLVVLDRNLFEVPPLEIHSVAVEMTVLGGRVVYERARERASP